MLRILESSSRKPHSSKKQCIRSRTHASLDTLALLPSLTEMSSSYWHTPLHSFSTLPDTPHPFLLSSAGMSPEATKWHYLVCCDIFDWKHMKCKPTKPCMIGSASTQSVIYLCRPCSCQQTAARHTPKPPHTVSSISYLISHVHWENVVRKRDLIC